ncbi:putative phosphorylated adapter RNA export RNA-binding protein [Lupinus albus]|uniref:Phosphorylated adapter RNA export protein n=1 Tax=Lupinus albus TaxID=3870 RepID=A0A6A4N472_LUPAL|nr:putative phosphorylated adapter RNA export RNA-binding protein [Lupinus albus]
MNVEENILESILEDNNLDDFDEDVDMIDIEEGELVEEHDSVNVSSQTSVTVEGDDKKCDSKNRKRRAKKKKNKRKRNGSGPNVAINIDRFVLDTCRRLKEKKSYMVYTAVGCLGLSAISDIIKEVDAIQACGGQKTADDKRFRTGGGVLWNIIKVREPQAYKEIMKKTKEFEKQFRHPNVKQQPMQKKEDDSPGVAFTFVGGNKGNVSDSPFPESQKQDQPELSVSGSKEKHVSVHDRLRTPVSYDDDLLELSADKNAN